MSIPGSSSALFLAAAAAGAGGYQVQRSLRFNSSDSAYLSRTPASAGNRKTWTWAGWVKRSAFGSYQYLFCAGTSESTDQSAIRFNTDETIDFFYFTGSFQWRLNTTQVFRDPSSWYHIVAVCDTDNATANSRARLYVNGSEVTVFATRTNPASGSTSALNNNVEHRIGIPSFSTSTYQFSGYLADVHFIDGQALDPSSFTETSATTGQLIPKAYTGSYGTNGFRLTFSDNSGTTSTTLGKDAAGSNNWSPNNFSVASGSGNDSLVDTPTSYGTDTGAGGEVRGNYCTLNPLRSAVTLSNGNLDAVGYTGGFTGYGTIGISSGKWYFEMTATAIGQTYYPGVGVNTNLSLAPTTQSGSEAAGYMYLANGQKYNNGSLTSYGASFTANDVIGVALDMDAGTITFYKNGSTQGQAYSGITGTAVPCITVPGTASTCSLNFGQRPFAYTAPSGFKALCDTNLPTPVVAKPNTAFDVVTYTGNGSARSITLPGGFSPDLIWTKSRSAAYFHHLYDIVRGTNSDLCSNSTTNELTGSPYNDGVTAFNSSGYSLGTFNGLNENGTTYVAWAWDGGTSTVTNTQGSITSSVRANASAGFSIVTYTSTGGTATVGHGLGIAPSMVITKGRNVVSAFITQHVSLAANNVLYLNGTDASQDVSGNGSLPKPTSTVFSVNNQTGSNGGTYNMIAYCFAPVTGYSSGFSYTGNGSTDGVFVYLGLRAKLLLIKRTDTTGNWYLWDTVRNTYNVVGEELYPNLSNAAATATDLDILSNGFKMRSTAADFNASGGTYIGFAWAEAPFAYSRAR